MWSLYLLVSGVRTAARMVYWSVGRGRQGATDVDGSKGGHESCRLRKAKFVSYVERTRLGLTTNLTELELETTTSYHSTPSQRSVRVG